MQEKPVTPRQITAINTLIHKQGLSRHKADIVEGFTAGRTTSVKEMTSREAGELLSHLFSASSQQKDNSRLMKKLFAMAFEMGWCPTAKVVQPDGSIQERRNYQRLHEWVQKYGWLKKPLNQYDENELPKLVSIFETKIYLPYIKGVNSSH